MKPGRKSIKEVQSPEGCNINIAIYCMSIGVCDRLRYIALYCIILQYSPHLAIDSNALKYISAILIRITYLKFGSQYKIYPFTNTPN